MRLTRAGRRAASTSPPAAVKLGDALVFALGGRLIAVRVEALGERRGPPAEAQGLYSPLQNSSSRR